MLTSTDIDQQRSNERSHLLAAWFGYVLICMATSADGSGFAFEDSGRAIYPFFSEIFFRREKSQNRFRKVVCSYSLHREETLTPPSAPLSLLQSQKGEGAGIQIKGEGGNAKPPR